MKTKFLLFLLVAALGLMPRPAHANLGYWSAALVGTWKHPATGDVYRFNSNATYTLTNSRSSKTGVIKSWGYWKIVQPTAKESGGGMEGPVALLVKQRKITLQRNSGRRYTRNRRMDYRLVVDTVRVNGMDKRNLYIIDGAQWKRIG